MLTEKIKESLKKSWGDNAEALNCFCEVKIQERNGKWDCYVYAMNPRDEDEVMCIMKHKGWVGISQWFLSGLMFEYNTQGEFPRFDPEFRRIRADVLYKKLGGT